MRLRRSSKFTFPAEGPPTSLQDELRVGDPISADRSRTIQLVALGASAGGLESLERFFDGLRPMPATAFVVIQHLSPHYETMMDHLLARHTPMPVQIVTDGAVVEPGHVFVIPPKKEMVVRDGRLHLRDKVIGEVPHLAIDHFFESMADAYGPKCAAIVLSGTGSDGSRGIASVNAAGGLVLSESEATAKFTGMPRSALQTGCVDHVLAPEVMGELLAKHLAGGAEDGLRASQETSDELMQVFDLMRQECQIDFRDYKFTTVARRIERRMTLCEIDQLSDYIELLRADRDELRTLYRDMLIGVTKFFRDRACFEYLESEVAPKLFANADTTRGIRVWSAGCATGEEAYSLAILLDECRERLGKASIDLKVFASDVHPGSLNTAGIGLYSAETVANVSRERLASYFEPHGQGYLVKPEIRRLVMFAPHNVLQDPPFTDLDLVTCRNLLIYFDPAAQRKALTFFHFGLRKDGFLFLGPSETVGGLSSEFSVSNERCKVFCKKRNARLPDDLRLPVSVRRPTAVERAATGRLPKPRGDLTNRLETYDRLLNTIMPATLLVDENRKVLETFGGAEKMLRFPSRSFSNDLLDVAPTALRTPLSAVFRRVQKSKQPVRLPVNDVSWEHQEPCSVDILASPIETADSLTENYAIQLTVAAQKNLIAGGSAPNAELLKVSDDNRDLVNRLGELEDELRHSKDHLQATIEELESSNEELQATNEELISSNEELQSTNEELNSVNEELHTVNVEYQNKNAELRELNEDMNHLFSSTDIGTVFLDQALAIRRFTPRMASIFRLEERDVGRELASFSHSLVLDNLHEIIRQTLVGGEKVEREVTDRSGNHYFLRILPYVVDGNIAGVILTLTDISSLVAARELAEKYERRLQRSIDAVPVFVSYINAAQEYEYANQAYRRWLQLTSEEILGNSVQDVLGEETYEYLKPRILRALGGESQTFEQELSRDGESIHLAVSYTPNISRSGEVRGFYVSGADVTRLKAAEKALEKAAADARAASEAKSDFLAKMSHEIRSPMTAILGFADILDSQLDQPDNRDCVDVIRRNGHHLLELINDILDLARVESGKLELDLQTFVPADLVRECHNTVEPKANSNNTELVVELDQTVDQPLLGDRRRLRQVILNLLSNAAKFCEGGSIELTAARIADDLQITVSDNGCGIDEDDLPTLFEPFSQADNSDTRRFEGSGLGLAITKQLVECMDGAISVQSKLGEGSTFRVTVPWIQGDALPPPGSIELARPGPRLDSLRVMVIDDRRDVRFVAEHMLRDAGATVDTAEDGQQGIELLEQLRAQDLLPDCIVTDIQMPDMDGYETARRLRAGGYERPILALSASAMQEEREKCLEAGCNAHLAKPINKAAFVQTIADLIGDRAIHDD